MLIKKILPCLQMRDEYVIKSEGFVLRAMWKITRTHIYHMSVKFGRKTTNYNVCACVMPQQCKKQSKRKIGLSLINHVHITV